MPEFSGLLSERVRFEGREEVRGSAGDRLGGWGFRFERWARVEPLARADRTADAGDTRYSQRRWKLTMRDGPKPTLDMRIRWRGLTLMPTGIESDPAEPGRMTVWAEDVGG